jgi:hypothetical protein
MNPTYSPAFAGGAAAWSDVKAALIAASLVQPREQ